MVGWGVEMVLDTIELVATDLGSRVHGRVPSSSRPVPERAASEYPLSSRWQRCVRSRPHAGVSAQNI
jgi:hypothetical protein